MTATPRQIDYAISLRDKVREWDEYTANTDSEISGHDQDREGTVIAMIRYSKLTERQRNRTGASPYGPDSLGAKLARFLAPRDETLPLPEAIDKQTEATIAALLARRAEIAAMTDEQIAALDSATISTLIDDAKRLPR